MEPLYKIVGPNGECLNGGSGAWSLPDGDKPGEWREVGGPIVPCRNGLHLATAAQLPQWYHTDSESVVYRAETDGPLLDHGDKWVAVKVRLLPRSRPMPDFARARALDDKRRKRAARLLNTTVPATWREYLTRIGDVTLPAAHPGATYQAVLRDAQRAHDAAIARAEAAYLATIRKGIMP